MKNLENFGVQELNAKEMENTNGGIFGALFLAALCFSLGYGLAQLIFGEN